MWGASRSRTRHRISVPVTVVLFQLAASTVVPAIHPFLHPTSHVGPVVLQGLVGGGGSHTQLESTCFACQVSAATLASAPVLLARSPVLGQMLPPRPRIPTRHRRVLRGPWPPNPIGVTVVDLHEIEGHVLRVRGLDAFDGAPVLDIKPVRNGKEG